MEREQKWMIPPIDEQMVRELERACDVPTVVARLLIRRGLCTPAEADVFLHGSLDHLPQPLKMRGMDRAVIRIQDAIARGEKIVVYGDYDVDGVASTSLLWSFLREMDANVDYYVPHRFEDGYGLHSHVLHELANAGTSLIVTVDTGISACQEAALARELGLDLIITDHHTPPEVLPDAHTIVNPKQPGCTFPDPMIAGVGVAFYVASAMAGRWVEEWLDLVALGSVADIVPLTGSTRIMVRMGLQRWNSNPRVGLEVLAQVAGIAGRPITATQIGFSIAPRLNAAGRMDHASTAIQLLSARTFTEATNVAEQLDVLNRARQAEVERVLTDAAMQVERDQAERETPVIVVAGEGWHAGVIGIVAAKMRERYGKPTAVISLSEGIGKGSARGGEGFDWYAALDFCRDTLVQFGGHKAAAGLTIEEFQIETFRSLLVEFVAQGGGRVLDDDAQVIDDVLTLSDVNLSLAEAVADLEPFGQGNPTPCFAWYGLRLSQGRRVGSNEKHLQVGLQQGGRSIRAIAFGRGGELESIQGAQRIDMVGAINVNEWRGSRSAQLAMEEWRASKPVIIDARETGRLQSWMGSLVTEHVAAVVVQAWPNSSGTNSDSVHHQLHAWDETAATALADMGDVPHHDGPTESNTTIRTVVCVGEPTCVEEIDQLVIMYPSLDCLVWTGWAGLLHRERLGTVYRHLRKSGPMTLEDLAHDLATELELLQPLAVWLAEQALCIFTELGFTAPIDGMYHILEGVSRRDLSQSPTFQRWTGLVPASDIVSNPLREYGTWDERIDLVLQRWYKRSAYT